MKRKNLEGSNETRKASRVSKKCKKQNFVESTIDEQQPYQESATDFDTKKEKKSVQNEITDREGSDQGIVQSRLQCVNQIVSSKLNSSSQSGGDGNSNKRLIVVLEDAHLEVIKTAKGGFSVLNIDEHAHIMRKMGSKKVGRCGRPDITHQCLMMLLDSPLNRAGLLQCYVHTTQNVLIEIHPQTRIPRTYPRFAGLMLQLLHKYTIRASDTSATLLKVIKNPITDHLPVGCPKLLMTYSASTPLKASQIAERFAVAKAPERSDSGVIGGVGPVCVVIGAVAKGQIEVDYAEESLCIGNYPLSAAMTCAKLTSAFEDVWSVL